MSQHAPHTKLTVEDYRLFPNDGKRHEIIDGEHYMTPSPTTKHQRISVRITSTLHSFVRQHNLGEIFEAPFDVILSDVDVVQPDILFVSAARASIIGEANVQGPPDLVVEILSAGTRRTDEIVKRKRYEHFGVKEYWVVDPELESVKVYRLREGGYVREAELSREANDVLTSPLLPNLTIPLHDLFC